MVKGTFANSFRCSFLVISILSFVLVFSPFAKAGLIPDLIITDFIAPNVWKCGEWPTLSVTVKNIGNKRTNDGICYINFELYKNGRQFSDANWTGFTIFNSLEPGESITLTGEYVPDIDPEEGGGTYDIVARVNAGYPDSFYIFENPMDNNTYTRQMIVEVPDLVLTVSGNNIPYEIVPGQKIEDITWEVINQGNGTAEGYYGWWYDQFMISADNIPDDPDVVVEWLEQGAYRYETPLSLGESYSNMDSIVIPNIEQGIYNLIITTDLYPGAGYYNSQPWFNGWVSCEADRRNNYFVKQVQVKKADLMISNVILMEYDNRVDKDHLMLTWTVTNIGDGKALSRWYSDFDPIELWIDSIYVSKDNNLDSTDTKLDSAYYSDSFDLNQLPEGDVPYFTQPLEPGESYTAYASVSKYEIDSALNGLESGYLIVATDAYDFEQADMDNDYSGNVFEINENNNTVSLEYIKPKMFGIFIGVNDGISSEGQEGARLVYEKFRSFSNWAKILPQSPIKITNNETDLHGKISNALSAIRSEIQIGDTLIFYYHGHGGRDISISNTNHDETLVNGDTRDEVIGVPSSNITDDELKAFFNDTYWTGVRKIFILDSCYSGGFEGTSPNDSGDLNKLFNYSLIAAASEINTTQSFTKGTHIEISPGKFIFGRGIGFFTEGLLSILDQSLTWPLFTFLMENYLDGIFNSLGNGTNLFPILGLSPPYEEVPFSVEPVTFASPDFNTEQPIFALSEFIITNCKSDFDSDGVVDGFDIAIFASGHHQVDLEKFASSFGNWCR